MPGGKFKVLAGKHIDPDRKVYRKGQVVESEDDLDTKFKGKFERIGGPNLPHPDHDDSPDASGAVMDDSEEVKEKRRQASMIDTTPGVQRRPRGGSEARKDEGKRVRGIDPEKGDEEEAKARRKPADDLEEDRDARSSKKQKGKASDDEDEEAPDFGMDVTEDFEGAEEAEVQVFKGEDGFRFVKSDDPKTSVNPEPFTSKKEARQFFKEQFGQEEGPEEKAKKKAKKKE